MEERENVSPGRKGETDEERGIYWRDETDIYACCMLTHPLTYTSRLTELCSEVWKLFYLSSSGVPALLPCAMLPKQVSGTHKKQLTKPTTVNFVS